MKIENKRVLVTGGAGFIGSNLVDGLIAANNEVVVLDDMSTGKRENLNEAQKSGRLKLIEGSILNEDLLTQAVKGADVVFHMAVQCLRICFEKPEYVHDVNATGTLRLLNAVQNEGRIQRFVYCSSSEVYGTAQHAPMAESHPLEPTTVYGASKLAGELYTQAFNTTTGMPTVIVRPFNTYGYREHHEGTSGEVIPRFAVRLLNNQPPVIFGDGTQTRDFTFVTDTVKGLILVAENEAFIGDKVNVAFGREVNINDIASHMLKIFGKQDLKVRHEKDRPADVMRHYADISKLKKHTNFQPTIAIEEGLVLYANWLKTHYSDFAALLEECTDRNWNLKSENDSQAHAGAKATAGVSKR